VCRGSESYHQSTTLYSLLLLATTHISFRSITATDELLVTDTHHILLPYPDTHRNNAWCRFPSIAFTSFLRGIQLSPSCRQASRCTRIALYWYIQWVRVTTFGRGQMMDWRYIWAFEKGGIRDRGTQVISSCGDQVGRACQGDQEGYQRWPTDLTVCELRTNPS
jgi:hypothetical protein